MRFALPPKGSLQRRLSLALAGAVAALWLIATLAAGLILHEEIDEVFDSALQEVAQRVLPLAYIEVLNRGNDLPENAPPEQIASAGTHKEYITYLVRDAKGRVLMQSHDARPETFPDVMQVGFVTLGAARFYTEGAVRGTLFVTTAERPDHRRRAVIDAAIMLIWPLVGLLPLSLVGIWALVARTLKPVTAFQREIETRGGGNLAPLEPGELPTEINPVAEAVNRLMARLRRTLEVERSFTANSAHELRTPVAAALAQTQRLASELQDGPSRARAVKIEVALRRLTRLSEKLLQLAKAEGGGLIADVPQDAAQVLALVLDDFRANPGYAARLALTHPVSGPVFTTLDVDAFAILARNLIENALKHGAADKPVRIRLDADGVFSVANAGPVVAPETLGRLTNPFERGQTQADGAGLGLAIARTIAQGAGTELELLSPRPGETDGFEARVRLPESVN